MAVARATVAGVEDLVEEVLAAAAVVSAAALAAVAVSAAAEPGVVGSFREDVEHTW